MTVDTAEASPPISITSLTRENRAEAEDILRGTAVFREDEIVVAMEVLDSFFTRPEQDYSAVAAITSSEELLGFAVFGATPCTLGTWDLYWIAVSAQAQGTGVGTLLLQDVEQRLKVSDARLLLIETSSRPPYDPTRAFYLKRGYDEVARVPDFYEVGDDRVIYSKTLDV